MNGKTDVLGRLAVRSAYWWALLVLGVSLEGVALSYQYLLDYGPCPLCIHVRIGVLGMVLVALLALLIRSLSWRRFSHLLNVLGFGWLSERAFWLLGTEKGFAFTECGLDAGLPGWLALDAWFPSVFAPWESCGFTPPLLFGISMAEASMVLFPVLCLLSVLLLILSLSRH